MNLDRFPRESIGWEGRQHHPHGAVRGSPGLVFAHGVER